MFFNEIKADPMWLWKISFLPAEKAQGSKFFSSINDLKDFEKLRDDENTVKSF